MRLGNVLIRCVYRTLIFMFLTLVLSMASANETKTLLQERNLDSICSGASISMRWNDNDWFVDEFEPNFSQKIFVKAIVDSGKSGAQIVSVLNNANENTLIVGHPSVTLDLKGQPLVLKSGSSIDGKGMQLVSSKKIHSFIRNRGSTRRNIVENLIISAKSMERSASIDFTAVDGLIVRGNTISGNTNSAIVVASSETNSSKNIIVSNNKIHSPGKAVGHLVMIKNRTRGRIIKCVAVLNNHVLGSDPENLRVEDYTPENEFSADQIVLHGVEGFLVYGNYSGWSGSAGYTISRLSRDGVIHNNVAEHCYEPGFNIGSGIERVEVKSSADVLIGESLTNGRASFQIKSVIKNSADLLELRGKVRKGIVEIVDTLSYGTGKKFAVIKAHQRGVENVVLIGNNANDTSIQRQIHKNLAAYNVVRSTNVFLMGNQYANPDGVGRANKFASFSVSQGYISENSVKKYGSGDIQVAGPGAAYRVW